MTDPSRNTFDEVCVHLNGVGSSRGLKHYESAVGDIALLTGARSLLEIGAGRNPQLAATARHLDLRYGINDIDQRELDLAPNGIEKLMFDVAAPAPDGYSKTYDLVVSRSVLEHVRGVDNALDNTVRLLNPGGFALHFAPTLFALPFVANRLLPERVGLSVLRLVAPRNEDVKPKFPALYDKCRSTKRNENRISARLSPHQFAFVPFYDHGYYKRVPVLRDAAQRWHRFLAERDARFFSSYCFFVIQRAA